MLLPRSQCFAPFGEDGETEAECDCTRMAAAALHLPHASADPQEGAVQFFLGAPHGRGLSCSQYLGQQN